MAKAKAETGLATLKDEAERLKAKFWELFPKANKEHPRPEDVEALRALIRDQKGAELWRQIGGLMATAEYLALKHSGVSQGITACWEERLKAMALELAGDAPSPLEQMLAQHAALCWARLALTELEYTQVMSGGVTLTKAAYYDKHLGAAQRRFTRACETLARVRKLARYTPALQVNIAADGGQQVNVAPGR